MDLLEQGKQLLQQSNFEAALDSLLLALENDKENADVHFYVGLCYSSMGQFGYAKFHYQIALSINPNHAKTKFVWNDIKNIEVERPPERKLTRAATAKIRKTQAQENKPVVEKVKEEPEVQDYRFEDYETPAERDESGNAARDSFSDNTGSRFKLTDEKWEQAFPIENLNTDDRMGVGTQLVLFLIAAGIIGMAAYFVYDLFA